MGVEQVRRVEDLGIGESVLLFVTFLGIIRDPLAATGGKDLASS